MSQLFDNITRIVGSPVPRRQALKAIGGALLGVVFAGSSYRKTRAAADQTCCQGDAGTCVLQGTVDCNYATVAWTEIDCIWRVGQWLDGGSCCTESLACRADENCCGFICCPPEKQCFGGVCCTLEQLCGNPTVCCPPDHTCLNGACCLSTRVCMGMNGNLICCQSGRCCGGTKCCPGGCTPNGNCAINNVSAAR
jgi:hypothetical protein